MLEQLQLFSGVNVTVNSLELEFLKYLKKVTVLPTDKLNSEGKHVINKLLSKGVIVRTKKGNYVYVQLRSGICLPKNQ
jgi:hypothetical protein